MKTFYDINIFTRKKFHKETQVDFNEIEICLLKNKIKQLELFINCLNDKKENEVVQEKKENDTEKKKENEIVQEKKENNFLKFGIDENDKRYIKKQNEYILYY